MYRKMALLFTLCSCSFLITAAQTKIPDGMVTLKVTDGMNKPLPGVTVSLLQQKDSILLKFAVTETDGSVTIEVPESGNYFIRLSHTAFETLFSSFVIDEKNSPVNLGVLILQPAARQLAAATVISQKPFIERLTDRTIVNVENSIVNAGSTALEVLEKSPGVVIDRNSVITLKGKQGVIILINGKNPGISGSELANYLRGLPAGSISKIEIITNPSAKYDAAGNAGIINIVMKKDQRMGTNGTLNLSYGQGFYPRAGSGISLNHRGKDLNIFGSYNYNYSDSYSNLVLYRQFIENGNLKSIYDQTNFIEFLFKTNVYRAGIDYKISKKSTVGVVVNGLANKFNSDGNTHTDVLNNQSQKISYDNNYSNTKDSLKNYAVNLNFKHTFDSSGKELTIDADYAHYHNHSGQGFITNYYHTNGSAALPTDILTGIVDGKLSIQSIKADYSNPLAKNAKIETGIKTSLVKADNDLQYFDASNGVPVYNPGLSNHFVYEENINAAYINYSKEFKKISLQFGLRAEQTNADGRQLSTGQQFDTSYLQFFPSVFLNYTASPKNSFGLSFSRRIDRPTYRQLNPFRFYINNSTFTEGNPYLQPQFTYSIELSHTYQEKITTTFSYSITKNNIINVIIPSNTQDNITIQTDRNLAQFDYYGLTLSAPLKVTAWWNIVNNLTAYYGLYKGNLANTSIHSGRPTFTINSSNTFTIGKKGIVAELNGIYNYRELYAYMDIESYGFLSAGFQTPFFKKKGTVKLNIADLFHSNSNTAKNSYRDYIEDFTVKRDTRVVTISFTYRFGNSKVAAARRMSGGAEEEKQRAK